MDETGVVDDWKTRGSCRAHPVDLFFPNDGIGVQEARKICADCPVKAPCLEYALRHRIGHGVWGGASERERRRIARHRRSEPPAVSEAPSAGVEYLDQRAAG